MEKKIKELVEELRNYSVPELCDGMEGGLYHTMDYQIKPHVTQQKIVGPAFTVKVPVGEGAIVTNALEQVGEGEVVVIAGSGESAQFLLGRPQKLLCEIPEGRRRGDRRCISGYRRL